MPPRLTTLVPEVTLLLRLRFKSKVSNSAVNSFSLIWPVLRELRTARVTIRRDKLRVLKLTSHFLA